MGFIILNNILIFKVGGNRRGCFFGLGNGYKSWLVYFLGFKVINKGRGGRVLFIFVLLEDIWFMVLNNIIIKVSYIFYICKLSWELW